MHRKTTFFLFALWLLSIAGGFSADLKFSAASAPELDALFQRTNGWIGADGSFSVPLSKDKTLWLFSDTWVGGVSEGKRVRCKMINNSIALQRPGGTPEFFYRTNKQGEAASFITPSSGEGFFWLFHGAKNERGLYIFLKRVKTVGEGPFGFRLIGSSLGFVKNPDDPPMRWKIEQKKIPFSEFSQNEKIFFGSSVLEHESWFYIFGNQRRSDTNSSGMIVARVAKNELGNFKSWRFYSGGEWKKHFKQATPICEDAVSETSVFYEPALKKFVFLYSQGLKGKIVARTAHSPIGPWSQATELFQCPEMDWSKKIFCYAGKAHPQLAAKPGEWIITYASNSYDFWDLLKEARLYWPRFVRVELNLPR